MLTIDMTDSTKTTDGSEESITEMTDENHGFTADQNENVEPDKLDDFSDGAGDYETDCETTITTGRNSATITIKIPMELLRVIKNLVKQRNNDKEDFADDLTIESLFELLVIELGYCQKDPGRGGSGHAMSHVLHRHGYNSPLQGEYDTEMERISKEIQGMVSELKEVANNPLELQ